MQNQLFILTEVFSVILSRHFLTLFGRSRVNNSLSLSLTHTPLKSNLHAKGISLQIKSLA